jgi:hypothetical protein
MEAHLERLRFGSDGRGDMLISSASVTSPKNPRNDYLPMS